MNAPPNLPDLLAAEWAQQEIERIEALARKARRNWFQRLIDGDCFYLICGAIVAFDVGLVIGLVRGSL